MLISSTGVKGSRRKYGKSRGGAQILEQSFAVRIAGFEDNDEVWVLESSSGVGKRSQGASDRGDVSGRGNSILVSSYVLLRTPGRRVLSYKAPAC